MGKLAEQPLAELIREISFKGLSGALRLEYERVQTAVYFDSGQVIYAAANLRTLRLREYLIKRGLVSEQEFAKLGGNTSDLNLAATLSAKGIIRQKDIDVLLAILVSDILRVALLWVDGTWDFDPRARLADPINLKVDTALLLREAAQRIPITFVTRRFLNPGETITRVPEVARTSNFLPSESFILSRLDKPLKLEELVTQSGLPEFETQRVIYGLALSGVVIREYWQNVFRGEAPKTTKAPTPVAPAVTTTTQQSDNWVSASVEHEEMEAFLGRLKAATNHYEVLDLPTSANPTEIKDAYYAMARRYHPDRFHLIKSGTKTHAEISSAFARVTQAYEVLTNPNARAGYDAGLERARQFALAEAKRAKANKAAESSGEVDIAGDDSDAGVGRAEYSFREGCGALDQGRVAAAVKYLANAARLEPHEARYRAYYGRALAADANTRRLAENEMQAAVKLEPTNAVFRTMLAELYFELKFHKRAQTEVERALSIEPGNVAAKALLRKLEKSSKVG